MSRAAAALILVGASFLAPSALHAQTNIGRGTETSIQQAAGVTDSEQFVNMAAVSSIFEIRTSEVALEKSQDEKVLAFARQMIADHQAALDRMTAVVAQAGVQTPMPTELDILSADKFNTLRGESNFDVQYVRTQIESHEVAIALFQSYASGGDNEVLKQFAAETLPKLQEHRQMLPPEMPAL
jgi:putative membrane protein